MKETKKQIKAQLTNELSRKYRDRISEAEDRAAKWHKKYADACETTYTYRKLVDELKEENESLKEELKQHREWIERMQEFCNLPEDEREEACRTYIGKVRSEKAANEAFTALEGMYSQLFKWVR